MTGLRAELARVGIRGRLAERIVLELDDHLRCDPAAELGAPRELAERFAEELRVPRTRRSTYAGFTALVLAALSIGISASGGGLALYGARGWIQSLGGLAVVLGGQVSFVAGVLALWGALKGPQTPPELRLVQRRMGVALVAGGFTLAAHSVQTVVVEPYMSTLWLVLAISAALVPTLGLGAAAYGLHGAIVVTPATEPARRPFPWRLVIAIGAAAAAVIAVGSAFTEHSWMEGLSRGVVESIAFATCFAVFGRRLGIRR